MNEGKMFKHCRVISEGSLMLFDDPETERDVAEATPGMIITILEIGAPVHYAGQVAIKAIVGDVIGWFVVFPEHVDQYFQELTIEP